MVVARQKVLLYNPNTYLNSYTGLHSMRASVLQENLSKGLAIVNRAISSRPSMPVLHNVLLTTDESRLKLSATNLELGITTWIGAKVEEEGAITVPARLFHDLVNTLSP